MCVEDPFCKFGHIFRFSLIKQLVKTTLLTNNISNFKKQQNEKKKQMRMKQLDKARKAKKLKNG